RLVAEYLPLKVRRDREDFEAVGLRHVHALLRVRGRAGVGVALPQVEFPRGFFPAIKARVGDELDPLGFGDVPELPANQPDLVVAALAVLVLRSLLETHERVS